MYLYALAVSGGAVAYMPFLTILLPLRATDISGNGALGMLAIAAFLGAIAASVANIGFGWASDKTGKRRPWICAGLAVSTALLLATAYAKNPLTNKWYDFDDSRVQQVEEKDVCTGAAYNLFYRRRDWHQNNMENGINFDKMAIKPDMDLVNKK